MDCSLLATPGPDSNDVNFTQGKLPGNDIHKLNSQGEYLSSPNSSIVVFIDTGVIDYQRLQAGALPGISTVILSPAEDAMAEMTAYLQQNPQVTTVHIVSHGVPGRLYLGTSQIDLENICDYENLLKLWPVNIHILLYGCQVAAGDAGEEFIEKLHQLTGATVIASATHTGSIRLGGNWKLEAIVSRTGNQQDLNTPLAFCENTLATYAGVFAPLDDEPPQVSVTAITNGNEADGSPAIFRFSRTGSTTDPLSVSYRLLGTAQAGSDYTGATTGTISFSAGSATAELSLPALADSVVDPGETIMAQILPSTTATPSYLITPGQQTATATINAEGMVVTVNGPSRPKWSKGEVGNRYAFAALKSDGTVVSWGDPSYGGTTPAGLSGVTQIFSNGDAFTALKSDGTVVSWGNPASGGTTPAGLSGVTQIFSTDFAFAALKSDGTVVSWGPDWAGGTTPAGLGGVTQIFSSALAFAALKSDGTVVSWGNPNYGGTTPAGLGGLTQIFSNFYAFAALKSDGTVVSWGPDWAGGTTPAGLSGVTQIFSTDVAFAALKSDGTVVSWGYPGYGGTTPAGLGGVTQIFSTRFAFTALKSDGTVVSWGNPNYGGTTPAGLGGVTQIFSTGSAFAALKSDGTVVCWGAPASGGTTPAGLGGVTQIFSTGGAFAALKSDGTVVSWGNPNYGGTTPAGLGGVTQIFSNDLAFAALKSDGTVVSWGDSSSGGTTPAGLSGVVGFANPFTDDRLVLPDITLAVAPAGVAEDGTNNLVYTFTRTGPTTSALTVNYGITGTADASDYTGATPGAGKTISFAAGSSTASLTIDPTADTIIEGDETVLLTLAAGTGYTIGTTIAVVGTITNDDFPQVSVTAITNGN